MGGQQPRRARKVWNSLLGEQRETGLNCQALRQVGPWPGHPPEASVLLPEVAAAQTPPEQGLQQGLGEERALERREGQVRRHRGVQGEDSSFVHVRRMGVET